MTSTFSSAEIGKKLAELVEVDDGGRSALPWSATEVAPEIVVVTANGIG
jgi:hypothetical protein